MFTGQCIVSVGHFSCVNNFIEKLMLSGFHRKLSKIEFYEGGGGWHVRI